MPPAQERRTAGGLYATLVYLSGDDTRIDRANVALLSRVVKKSTNPLALEVWYVRPLQLNNWALAQESVRFVKLRSMASVTVAEQCTQIATEKILLATSQTLLHESDVWSLLGFIERHTVFCMEPLRMLRAPHETLLKFVFREAFFSLHCYLKTPFTWQSAPLAIDRTRFLRGIQNAEGIRAQKAFFDFFENPVGEKTPTASGRSFSLRESPRRLLNTLLFAIESFQEFRTEKKLPRALSARLLLFLVAQLSMYFATLTAIITFSGAFLLVGFAGLLTAPFIFSGAKRRYRNYCGIYRLLPLRSIFVRLLVLFIG